MARTKASVGAKVSSVKNSKARCSAAPPTTSTGISSASSDKARSAGGGNPVCPRETPKWQRPITNFFINKPSERQEAGEGANDEAAGSSKSKPKSKRNVIESDEEPSPEKPKNRELDETIELETLDGENSHKIQEYYPNKSKGKGVGKKTKEKKHNGVSERRDSDDISVDTESAKDEDMNEIPSDVSDKENVDRNIENKSETLQNSKIEDSSIKERSKRERIEEDNIEEEGNVSKKIKVN